MLQHVLPTVRREAREVTGCHCALIMAEGMEIKSLDARRAGEQQSTLASPRSAQQAGWSVHCRARDRDSPSGVNADWEGDYGNPKV